MAIRLNGSECSAVTVNIDLNESRCVAPAGAGEMILKVVVAGQESSVAFMYDGPVIFDVFPSPISANDSEALVKVCQSGVLLTVFCWYLC